MEKRRAASFILRSYNLFRKSDSKKYKMLMFREKSTNDSYVKNDIFQKVRKCPLNIVGMLNILDTIFKCTVPICNLNVSQIFTKGPQLG